MTPFKNPFSLSTFRLHPEPEGPNLETDRRHNDVFLPLPLSDLSCAVQGALPEYPLVAVSARLLSPNLRRPSVPIPIPTSPAADSITPRGCTSGNPEPRWSVLQTMVRTDRVIFVVRFPMLTEVRQLVTAKRLLVSMESQV